MDIGHNLGLYGWLEIRSVSWYMLVDMKEVSLNNNEFVGLDYSLGNRIYPSCLVFSSLDVHMIIATVVRDLYMNTSNTLVH